MVKINIKVKSRQIFISCRQHWLKINCSGINCSGQNRLLWKISQYICPHCLYINIEKEKSSWEILNGLTLGRVHNYFYAKDMLCGVGGAELVLPTCIQSARLKFCKMTYHTTGILLWEQNCEACVSSCNAY